MDARIRTEIRRTDHQKKRSYFHAVSASVCKLCSILSASSDSITTVSSMMHGEYGIDDVCLSPDTWLPNGIQGKVPMRRTKKEIEQLHKSADALKGHRTDRSGLADSNECLLAATGDRQAGNLHKERIQEL